MIAQSIALSDASKQFMIKKVAKIGILFLRKDKEKILEFLQKMGTVEIIERREIEKEAAEEMIDIRTKVAKVKFALDFLGYFERNSNKKTLKEKIEEAFSPAKNCITEAELKSKVKNFNFGEIVKKCEDLEEKKNEVGKIKENLEKKLKLYKEWRDLPYNLKDFEKLRNLKIFCGTAADVKGIERKLKEKTDLYELKIISNIEQGLKETKFCLFYHPLKEKEVQEIIKKFEAKEVKEIEKLASIQTEIEKIKAQLRVLIEDKKRIDEEIKKVSSSRGDLEVMYDYFNWQEGKKEAGFRLFKTEKISLIMAWVDESKINNLKKNLKKVTENSELFKTELKKGEEIPIIVENKKIIKPVEPIMDIYGTPKADEVDPVPFMAPFFILFFGFCLSDAGYGLILTILSLVLLKFLKIPPQNRRVFYLLLYCGISTVLMGTIFGSYFGINLETLPQGFIKDLLLKMKIADPMKDPILILSFALFLGILQIIFGIFIKMYWKMRNKMVKEALWDDFPWLYFIFTILFYGASKAIPVLPVNFASYLFLSGALAIILTQGRKSKNIVLKFFGGTLSLYGIISYLSDVLSYSRLLALCLATGVIASVVNLTAGIFKDLIPIIGGVVAVIILLVGHIFNILTSSLGAFVHSMRLQFVEFIPKFMEGGGRKLKPFSRESKYVEVTDAN